jgi:hypothetical protein
MQKPISISLIIAKIKNAFSDFLKEKICKK